MKKTISCIAIALAASATFAALPTATASSVVQNGDRSVSVAYTLANGPAIVTFAVETNATGDTWANVDAKNLWRTVGAVNRIVTAQSNTFTWEADDSELAAKFAVGRLRVILKAWTLSDPPDYVTVDLTQGAGNSWTRFGFYEDVGALPGGLLGNTEYRTSILVMKRIHAANVAWTMGTVASQSERVDDRENQHEVTLTDDYYMGVFPLTQGQTSTILDAGMQYSSFTRQSAMRIRDQVYYDTKGNVRARDANWPADPASGSVLGKLRTMTAAALAFDLPTEAQWEFAARGGHGDGFWGNGVAYASTMTKGTDANLPGRYTYNQETPGMAFSEAVNYGPENGTPIAGSYAPNDYGLYDMNGGVDEWCLDWYQADITGLGGAVNISKDDGTKCADGTTSKNRVVRGGSWRGNSIQCRAAHRSYREGLYAGDGQESGMRVCSPAVFTVQED